MKKIISKIKRLPTTNYRPACAGRLPTNQGFTLIETLVAVLIFATSIVTLIVLTAGGVSNTNHVKNRLTAQYLSEEGIDLVRAIRDSDARYGNSQGIADLVSNCSLNTGGCIIEPINESLDSIESCGGDACLPLLLNEESGTYTYETISGNSVPSPYIRTIIVNEVEPGNSDELEIESTVSWTSGGRDFFITNHEYLYSWMMQYVP